MSMVYNFCYYATLLLVPIIVFVFFSKDDNFHSAGGFLYVVKYFFGRRAIAKIKDKLRDSKNAMNLKTIEEAKYINNENLSDQISFSSSDQNGNSISVKLVLKAHHVAEFKLCLRIDEKIYILPNKNDSSTQKHQVCTKSISNYQWKCHGMNIEILDPFKRCRLTFNGFLMEVSPENYGNMEHIKFSFIWNSCSKPNISWLDDDLNLLTRSLAETTWKNGEWLKLLGDEMGYVQFGGLRGIISGETLKETELNMACSKTRYWGTLESHALRKYLTVFAFTENGYILHFGVKSFENGCQSLKFGHVLMHPGAVFPIQNTDLEPDKINKNISDHIAIHVNANNKMLKLILSVDRKSSVTFLNNDIHGYKNQNIAAECTVNAHKGMAILDNWCYYKGDGIERPAPILRQLRVKNIPKIFVTAIGSEESKISELSGGKGNSLALMKNLNNKEVFVPDGFIITTYAFQQQIDNNFHLKKALSLLEDIALGKENGNLENACEVTVELFGEQKITPRVEQAIRDELMKFRRRHNEKIVPFLRGAVRSSAIGEDSEDFSSAGQNESFLGCQTHEDLLRKVCRCWGSLFSYQSVIYRRQHGLSIRTSMAVVVQMMIPAEAAGVMFTCHPSSLNPGQMVISSNFGLGETVVSGQVEPDTIIISKTFEGDVEFVSSLIGSKNYCVLLSRYGVHKSKLTNEKSNDLSLSKEDALRLGKIGVILEKAFGGPRDIEWAIFKGNFYILQSRPVTTFSQWSDYELLHELDTPHISNDTFYTRANVGEVLPFALTPLTQSTVAEGTEKGYQMRLFGNYDPYVSKSVVFSHHYCMIELLGGFYAKPSKEIDIATIIVDLAVFGHRVLDDDLNVKAIERYGSLTRIDKIKELISVAKMLWKAPNLLRKMVKNSEELKMDVLKNDNVVDIYEKIDRLVSDFVEFAHTHCSMTVVSIMYQIFATMILMEGEKEITTAHYNDMAMILSSCNDVISAEVPTRLEEIVEILRNDKLAEKFSSVDPDEGVEWLERNCEKAHKHLDDFLKFHGHRLLGEFELSLNSWEMDPSIVIKMIQLNCKARKTLKKAKETSTNIVDRLVSPNKWMTKKILGFLINKQRSAVGNREISKSALVKVINKLRNAYRALAREMVQQGLIPCENLIFHLTHHEIWQVIHRKNPNLIVKAKKREKLYMSWSKLKFPEIMYSMPTPETNESPKIDSIDFDASCRGTPVCFGDTTARACVINSLDEIYKLNEGDILISRCTDIGWSPYFPILSGIVTELGGLVSHGAVIAREYGLPCVVGAKDVTKIVKTGDIVFLSGQLGIVRVIPT